MNSQVEAFAYTVAQEWLNLLRIGGNAIYETTPELRDALSRLTGACYSKTESAKENV